MSEKLEYCLKKYKTCIDQLDEEEKDCGLDDDQEIERELYKVFLSELEHIKEEIVL